MTRPTDEEILDRITEVARRHLEWHGEIRPDQRIVESLALDSLRKLTLVVEIENHFHVCLDEQTEARIETVGDLVAVIRSKLYERTGNAE